MAPKNPGSRRRLANNLSHEQDLITRMFRGSMCWLPDRIAKSAWLDHVPFAFWLVDVLRPKRIVELGTHFGVSYSAMCQAVNQLGLAASCFAIDTWKGDEQAGFYDESVFGEFSEFHERRYGGFSRLVRSTFDEALGHFGNETIDLLHIDGQHTYEAVRHDYESWRPKLSTNSVVLFHDTNVREGDFGVFRFWRELTQDHLHFNFLHGYGLGVLGIGNNFPSELKLLFRANEEDHLCASVRECFRSLGRSVHLLFDVSKLQETTAVHGSDVVALRGRLLAHDNQVASLNRTIAERDRKIVSLSHELAVRASEVDGLRHQLTSNDKELNDLGNKIAEGDSKRFTLEKELAARMSEADGLRQRLLANDKQLTNLMDAMADRDSKVLVLKNEAAARAREADASDKRLADRVREISSLEDGIANRDRQIADFRYGLAEKNARIDYLDSVVRALYSSTSWQVTAPLRALRRGFTKAREVVSLSSKAKTFPILASNREKSSSGLRLVYISSEWYSPGHIYRVVHLTDAARLIGLDASWMKLEEVSERLGELSNAYAVIFWRTAWDERVEIAVATARQSGARIIFDVDDLMIDPDLARTSVIDGIRTQGLTEEQVCAHYALVRRSMLEADICTTTTEEIASYMRVAGKPTFVLPNGFDNKTLNSSRLAVRRRRKMVDDGVVRIGYASGTRTHQRDFAIVANALARILRERPQCRLVLFREKSQGAAFVDISEYSGFADFAERVEWRDFVPLERLPEEMARFDLNLAPLESGNPFCESKSELKYFEAALVDVVTIASPTGPFRRAIRNGETGFLAGDETAWYDILLELVDNPDLRRNLARAARYDAIRQFGTLRRTKSLGNLVAQLIGGREAAHAFELQTKRISAAVAQVPQVSSAEIIFESDNCRSSEVTVIMPVFNYAHYIVDALESVREQTLSELDLVVVDDCSTDESVTVALEWAKRNIGHFNRLLLLRNRHNAGLGLSRNVAFDAAETPYVLPLDPDNRLLPLCCERLLAALKNTDVTFAYPIIQQFDGGSALMGALPFEPLRFVSGNYIDAMALISKEAWVCVGGYVNMWGWEDYDFWCGLIEQGLRGTCVNEVLAEYRVHASSMLRTMTDLPENKRILWETISRRHPWLALAVC
jgi:glycosyltransferase involved in cell wall biosynthesis